MNKDIHVLYNGGSGGHICAHLILESRRHFCRYTNFPMPDSVDQFRQQFDKIKQQQWNIQDPVTWKDNEFWPANKDTAQSTLNNMCRLLLTCNPEFNIVLDPAATNVLIYTDAATQFSMSVLKRCFYFRQAEDINKYCYKECSTLWAKNYRNVKDDSWPDIELCNIDLLPTYIINEIQNLHKGFEPFIEWKSTRDTLALYQQLLMYSKHINHANNMLSNSEVVDLLPKVDHAVRLQDIVRSRGKCLLDTLGLPWYNSHANLINHWVCLHPKELQEKLLG